MAVARGGGEVKALAIDVEEALLDYLDMFYNLRRAGRALRKMGAIDFATSIAPGLRDVLITGKIKEAVTRRHDGRQVYDAVVVDAPPTGRITRFLGVTAEMGQLARSGPIKTQSDGVMAVLRSPQTAVHLVTLLEDMPVQETADAIDELTKAALPVGSVIVNMATEPVLPADGLARAAEGGLTGADLAPALAAAHLPARTALADALAAEVTEHAQRWAGAGRAARRRRGARPADRRAAAAAPGRWTSARCSSWPAGSRSTCAARSPRERRRRAAPRRPGRPLAPAMDLGALIADPRDPDHRLLRRRRRGQDDDVGGARAGRGRGRAARVVVLTIDPARRLAQSLGLEELDNEPRRVDVPGADGELHAMMLDMKRTFDDVVVAHSTPERAEQILDNPFYQSLSSSFSGTQEYMAMEKLGQLRASDQWDLIIVDTPPSRSALDFLDAPNRMSRFLDGTMIRLLTGARPRPG